jgi:hypothetical protein
LKDCKTDITNVRDFFNYAVEMDSGAMIYIPSFIKIVSGIEKLIGRIHRHAESKVIL